MGNKGRITARHFLAVITTGLFLTTSGIVKAQSPFAGLENLFNTPRNYIIRYTKTAPVIDGDINDAVWQQAAWTNDFEDIEGAGKPVPYLKTRAKMLWDDSCIYIAAQMEEPQVWAYLKKHDEIIYHDNDFEVFINPKNSTQQYYEFEFNALNTVLDLFMNKPYRDGGNAMINWDAAGLRSAVKVQGTLNDPNDIDKGWTIEIAIPINSITISNKMREPQEGTLWRINFSRVEWDTKAVDGKYIKLTDSNGYERPEHNWIWSAQGVKDMHFPERWGYLQFTKSSDPNIAFTMPYAEQQKQYLWLIYYREQLWYRQHGQYAQTLKDLGLDDSIGINNKNNALKLDATNHQFMAFITDDTDKINHTINNEGLTRDLSYREHE